VRVKKNQGTVRRGILLFLFLFCFAFEPLIYVYPFEPLIYVYPHVNHLFSELENWSIRGLEQI
jgi:hypothetical protein